MIAGMFSLVTLVVSVNQLILSQEFSPAGEHRDRVSGVMEFRQVIEERTGISTAPIEPTRIVEVLSSRSVANASEDSRETHSVESSD